MSAEKDSRRFVVPERYWGWVRTPRARSILSWILCFSIAAFLFWHAFIRFDALPDTPENLRRLDGNSGHTQIDFGGQWMMGRMVVCGYSSELYRRQRQWEVARQAYPIENESPLAIAEGSLPPSLRTSAKADEDLRHDAERMMSWLMGSDAPEWSTAGGAIAAPFAVDASLNPFMAAALQAASVERLTPEVVRAVDEKAVGGPLYPPVHAFFYAPLGAIGDAQLAYRIFQLIAVIFAFVAGLGISLLSRGRIWWSVATAVVFLYPGTRGGLDLGQNPTVTASIAIWGWVLAARGYNVAGGAVWGLLAFKPVWGLALFLVPVLTRRWRFCVAMVVVGNCLAAATLPFVGLHSWLDWLKVGQEASATYNVNYNWIFLSRDLQGIPRRALHNFDLPEAERDSALAKALAWSLWGVVFATTLCVYLRYGNRQRATGIGMAFLFLGAVLTCYHFMYYDILVSTLGFAVLFAEPKRFLATRAFAIEPAREQPLLGPLRSLTIPHPLRNPLGSRLVGYANCFPMSVLSLILLVENSLCGLNLQATFGIGFFARTTTGKDGATSISVPQLAMDTGSGNPLDTYLVIAAWLWCGWQLIRGEDKAYPPLSADEGTVK